MTTKQNGLDFCIDALRGAMMLSSQALQVEIAVCFIVYDRMGSTDLQAKKVLRGIYASAGRADCLTAGDPSYQTVNRRMARCADFFATVGKRKIHAALKGCDGQAAIDAVVQLVEPYQIRNMDDIAKRAGKNPQARKAKPGEVHLKTEHIVIDIEPDATADELLGVIEELRKLVEQKKAAPDVEISQQAA